MQCRARQRKGAGGGELARSLREGSLFLASKRANIQPPQGEGAAGRSQKEDCRFSKEEREDSRARGLSPNRNHKKEVRGLFAGNLVR